jgi:HAE1 family hydrophobic/amphiphilic exporter-1
MRIADVSIRRPVFAVMLIASLVGLGLLSVGRLGVDLFPRIEFPYVSITTVLEGASPETIESEVSDVLEESINTLSGIEELRSVSSEGLSQVFVQFELEEDPDVKAQEVRDAVSRARGDLPVEIEPPIVEKIDPDAAPILSVMVAGDRSIRDLTRYAKDIVKERLQRVPGVGAVALVGGREREIHIWADARRLRGRGLSIDDLIQAVQREHAEVPGGRFETLAGAAELGVKTEAEVEAVAGFEDIAVAFRDGTATRLRDVARVEDGIEDERSYAELDGVPGIALEIRRQSGTNTVEVARAVRDVVDELRDEMPAGIRLQVTRDVSRFIEASARDVGVDILLGGLLAVIVTLLFLRDVRSTLVVAAAIPASIVATFFLFFVMGFTLNILTLMALSVSIGLLIDDAIVVLESGHREIESGVPPFVAASRGTSTVAAAVVAGTASVLAVFVPIAFMEGVIGRFFYEYGLAISFAVAISLLIAVTWTPMLCARVLGRQTTHGRIFDRLERVYAGLERGYGALLDAALSHRMLTLGLAVVAVAIGLVLARGVPLEFSGHVDRSEFEGTVELRQGVGVAESKLVATRLGVELQAIPEVSTVFVSVGAGSRSLINEIDFYVGLLPKADRSAGMLEIMERARAVVRAAAPEAKNTNVNEISWISGGGFTSYNMEYGLRGSDLGLLRRVSEDLVVRMRDDPAFLDVRSSYEEGKPEIQVHLDRNRAADLGVPARSLAATLRAAVGGLDVATYQDEGKRYDVRVRLGESQRDDLADLRQVQVRSENGRLVDLTNLANIRIESGPGRIDREDRARKISLFANNPAEVALGEAATRLDRIVEEMGLPPGITGSHQGTTERMKDSARSVVFAFFLALAALYVILAVQFDSFSQPVVIMLTAPLSFAGAFAALRFAGTEMSIFAQIGLVALMGLVMKNGILLVDYANQCRSEGHSGREAIRMAGPVRLRPVLMTTFSTIAGMIPVAIATTDGAEWRNPMGVLVIGGIASSTALTLLVIPVAYTLLEDLRAWPARIRELVARSSSALALRRTARRAGDS